MRHDRARRFGQCHTLLPTESHSPTVSYNPSCVANQKSKTTPTHLSRLIGGSWINRFVRGVIGCFVLANCLGQNCVEIDQIVIPEDAVEDVLNNLPDVPWEEILPIYDAGNDSVVFEGDLVVLEASSSFEPSSSLLKHLSFQWAQTSGPAVELHDPTSLMCYFIAPQVDEDTILSFNFTANNNRRSVSAATNVEVYNIVDAAGVDLVADAGIDSETIEGQTVALDGSNSSGAGDLLFTWTQISGPLVILSTNHAAVVTFVAPQLDTENAVTLVFELTVSNGYDVASDLVSIIVGADISGSDMDGDGVPDCDDGCPNDPNKTEPGACGCGVADTDTDADGTADCNDTCPDDPNKIEPGVCGCGVADTDSDGDGTADCNDPCPNDPEDNCGDLCPDDPNKTSPGICGCGTPDTDGDEDGTPDCNDNCPSDPNKTEPGTCGCGVPDTDSDADGTADCQDNCPDDPNKIEPGTCGCGRADTDSDGDGMADCYDVCLNDPNKILPGICGCGIADTDSDGDQTVDCDDSCPNDPNKVDPGQCGCGVTDTDSDTDGVADCDDACPNDPNKLEPGQCGCGVEDTDNDTDGTADCNDACPHDPNKIEPGICGCGAADNDSDKDGTYDCNDECPNDPNKVEPGVCGCGVADTDSDGDGTPDCQDQDNSGFFEDFNGYAAGNNPVDWVDTNAYNSMSENDSLFQVFDLGGEKAFGTSSTEINIHSHYVGTGSASWSSYTYTGRLMITQPDGGIGVTFRSDYPNTDTYYRLRRYNSGAFHINPHGTSVTGVTDTGVVPATHTWYEFAIEVEDIESQTVIRAKVWAQGTVEPTNWQVNCYDTNAGRLTTGTIGLWSMGSGDKYWDDLAVSSLSCNEDSDGDGILDCHDQCPNDPNKSIPGTCGCGIPDTDSDDDGVPDCIDACPGEPDTDSDGDGVADCDDVCPGFDDTIDSDGDGIPDGCEPATLCAGPFTLDYGCSTVSRTFEIWNCGSGELNYNIEDNASWLSLSATSGSSAGGHDTITATVNRAGLTDGDHAAEITVSSNIGAPILILVTLASGCPQPDTQPMLTASRTSGLAPLAVFFDAVDPANGVVQPPETGEYANDHAALYYEWNFDDPYAGSWSTGRQNPDGSYPSKNTATGYAAAHVFEQPGDYTVRLRVRKPDGLEYRYSQPITVQPFTGRTFYVRQDGNDSNTGRGSSASEAWRTYSKAFGAISGNSIVQPGDRVLFQRGHVFSYASTARLTNAHNVIIGAYPESGDPESRPLIQYAGSAEHLDVPAFQVYGNSTALTMKDIRINGHSTTSGKYASGFAVCSFLSAGPVNDILLLRVGVEEFWNNYFDVGASPLNGLFLVESTIRNSNDYKGHMLLGKAGKLAILGSVVDRGPTGEGQWGNNMYLEGLDKSVISSNYVGRPNPTSATLHVAGNKRSAHHVVMTDNILDGTSSIPGRPSNVNVTFDATDPQNYWVDNLLFERNLVINGGELVLVREGNDKVTVRNNILIPSDEGTAVVLEREYLWGSLGPIKNMSIYNNTIVTNSTKTAIRVVASIDNIRISNNIIEHTSTASTARIIQVFGSASLSEITSDFNLYSVPNRSANAVAFSVGDNNYTLSQWLSSQETHSIEVAPQFANGDYVLLSTSPAIDAGMDMGLPGELPYDVSTRTPWPSITGANVYDIGAIEWRP